MTHRRAPSIHNTGTSKNGRSDSPRVQKNQRARPQSSDSTPPPPAPQAKPNLGMSPMSRYNHNLKVLRRRDPSITTIFDQFSHVCVYHHNGSKWEKLGYEGSMFLYERESYPPYGFYILNRMGMDDYIQRIHPEDDIGLHGSYLMLQSYPEYTSERIARAKEQHPLQCPDKFDDVYRLPVPPLSTKDKTLYGTKTVGLWIFATDAREPLSVVMTRLHKYIKRNEPYPEEFRYGPNKPPPPNPHLRTTTTSPFTQAESQLASTSSAGPNNNVDAHGTPAFNSLLAKLGAQIPPLPSPSRITHPTVSPSSGSSSKLTVDSLFAALSGDGISQDAPARLPPTSTTGIPLLDSIFASATPVSTSNGSDPPSSSVSSVAATIHPSSVTEPIIHSPIPTSTALPQILNQDVISTLLGLPPSRTDSAATSISTSTSHSSNSRSHPSSREGDCSDAGYSESSTVLDLEAELDMELQAAGASAGRPLLSREFPTGLLGSNSHERVNGDVTPRAPLPRLGSVPHIAACHACPPPMKTSWSDTTVQHVLSTLRSGDAAPTAPPVRADVVPLNGNSNGRRLVPFDEPDPSLWPYPRAPIDEDQEEEILELDFEDTSALSDADAFREAEMNAKRRNEYTNQKKKGKANGREQRDAIERSWDVPVSLPPAVPASPSLSPSPPLSTETRSAPTTAKTTFVPKMATDESMNVNGKVAVAGLDSNAVKESILDAVIPGGGHVDRNEFVREVLTLIHTDKKFVDDLWQDYLGRIVV
ncbi:uncharacterized protein BT62DRAFT_931874 [Guyanagaster necrorhizus]|uniref:mRNA-decapping enzyme 1B n=1 Tax=Guyanagaster necrorhizus TaxID=856835 RepID=A0A9P7VT44_9AGAR|nr:uncharacterized protein BT62DRAFT_931874 [Guyanagaster necrorhizus MCA 3950]KAG7446439.1 hypothetical protein BT62DRAFT_931874 [Guyanagaster necrorhizus MCA 3950]